MGPYECKLCWLHPEYAISYGPDKCEGATPLNEDIQISPKCHSDCVFYTRIRRAFDTAGLPDNCWMPPKKLVMPEEDIEAMSITQHVRRNVVPFVTSGQNLWIWSSLSGNGKTYRACSIAITYLLSIIAQDTYKDNLVRYVHIPKYVSAFELSERYGFENENRLRFLDKVRDLAVSELVVWDGLGYGSDSRIETTLIRSIINDRINEGRSNIFVSNKSIQEVFNIIGRDLGSRIENASLVVNFRGNDLRSLHRFQSY